MGFFKSIANVAHKGMNYASKGLKTASGLGDYVGVGMEVLSAAALASGNPVIAAGLASKAGDVQAFSDKLRSGATKVDEVHKVGTQLEDAFKGVSSKRKSGADKMNDAPSAKMPTSVVRAYRENPNQIVLQKTGYKRRRGTKKKSSSTTSKRKRAKTKSSSKLSKINRISGM